MHAYIVPGLDVMGGVCLYAAWQSLASAVAGARNRPLFVFSAICLLAAMSAMAEARSLSADDAAGFIRAVKTNIDVLIVMAVGFALFTARYADHRSGVARVALMAYAALGAVMVVFNELRPFGLQYARFAGITTWRLPWGEAIVRGVGDSDVATVVSFGAVDGVLVYAFAALYAHYRRSRDETTRWLLVAVGAALPLAVAGAIARLVNAHGLEPGPFGLLLIIAAMSVTLARDDQRRVRSSEDGFRQLFERSPAAVVAVAPKDGRILRANAVALQLVGCSAQELLGRVVTDLAPAGDRELAARWLGDLVAAAPSARSVQARIVHKDGSVRDVECVSSVIQRASGDIDQVLVSAADITERKRAKVALRESEMRLRTLIDQSPVGISFSRDGTTLEVNSCYLQMFGCADASEVRGTSLLERIAPRCRAEVERRIALRRTSGQAPSSYEAVGLRMDGSEFPIFVSARRIELADGPLTMAFVLDFTERKLLEERVNRLAYFDRLTGLPNRELLHERLDAKLSGTASGDRCAALLLVDLDDFKSVNDTRGHEVGDTLLQQAAQRIGGAVGGSGWVARLGGDEFVAVLCTDAPTAADAYSQARDLGTRLMEVLEVPYSIGAHDMRMTCCVGASLCAGDATRATGLLKQADIALHEAKQTGRGTLRVFDPDMQSRVTERVELESELYKALERGQFELHYQVQVDDCARAIGAEALLRWRHPERGLVSPGHFMALAEASGAIVPIGRWVIDTACAQLWAWQQDARTRELTLAVNVSSRQIQQPDFADQVRHALRAHGVDGRRLKLELTETMLQFDVGSTIGIMRELKCEGVQFSLDDFGTGYSSLQYLKQLPLDQLKVDQSFVRDIVSDPNDRAIVATVVAMAASLQVDVIAEGVETPEQLAVLRSLDCIRFQGYLFGRPLAPDAFRAGL